VLAARLSERRERSILLLEAGPDHTSATTPAGVRSLNLFHAFAEPGRIWPKLTETRAAGQSEKVYVRGRGAGGSSSVNAMGAIRGTRDDYERWAGELGCGGWGWPEMLEAFRRVEDDADFGVDGLHGKGGPIPLVRVARSDLPPLARAVRTAAGDLGYPECDDYHEIDATGISRIALTIRDGYPSRRKTQGFAVTPESTVARWVNVVSSKPSSNTGHQERPAPTRRVLRRATMTRSLRT
jgi:5-(hydroxymethyl)furfural/furfural oxidase